MTLRYPELDSVRNEIRSEVRAYIHAITILSSLREHFRNLKIKCYIEMKLRRKDGHDKIPDLLIHANDYLIVDHKYTESRDVRTLSSKVEEMREYDNVFIFPSIGSETENEFRPEIVMLTPKEVVEFFKGILNCPITWGYTLNEEITINQNLGSVKDPKISSLFRPTFVCPIAAEISRYKFIISHPPLPYTAHQVYTILWNLCPPTKYFTPEFEVKYNEVLNIFNGLFPPWISDEIKQLNNRRLNEALGFLQSIEWIKWYESEGIVVVYRSKGRYIADLFSYLIDSHVKTEHENRVREYEKRMKELKAAETAREQRIITEFI